MLSLATKSYYQDDFDQDIIIGNAANEKRDSTVVNEGTNDRDFTVGTSSNNIAVNESTVDVKTSIGGCENQEP